MRSIQNSNESESIKTVGLLIDESNFLDKENLISELIAKGIDKNRISVLVYKDSWKKNETYSFPTFCLKHVNWNLQFTDTLITDFVKEKFDLLINYYDVEKAFLLKATNNSSSKFKVGFNTVDNKLNHLMINTQITNHRIFVEELFRYLNILKKI